LGLPIPPIGPHKRTGAVERFHITLPRRRAALLYVIVVCHVPAASKSTYALCSGSLIRKIDFGMGAYDVILKYDTGR
jgi:hypothetical protein